MGERRLLGAATSSMGSSGGRHGRGFPGPGFAPGPHRGGQDTAGRPGGDQTFQARFRREAQSSASLNHPSIVAVYDTGEDMMSEVPVRYIVMEYANGRTRSPRECCALL